MTEIKQNEHTKEHKTKTVFDYAQIEILEILKKYALSFDEDLKLDNEMTNDVLREKVDYLLEICSKYE